MATPLPSHPLKGAGGHDAAAPQDLPSGRTNNKVNINKKKRKAKKTTKAPSDQEDPEVSEAETDTTANIQTDLDTDGGSGGNADAEADAEADIDVEEMPKRPPPPPKRDVDISIILNWQQRLQFDALNQAILANIEAQALKPFNFLDHPIAKNHRVKIWKFGPAIAAAQDAQPSSADGPTMDAKTIAKDDASAKEGEAEDNACPRIVSIDVDSVQSTVPSMKILKEEAAQYFNKWKVTFSKRCNDLTVPRQSVSDACASRQGQGAFRGGGTGAFRSGRHQQEGMFSLP